MNKRIICGLPIAIDSFEEDGTPLNDSPLEDSIVMLGEPDDRDVLCVDQMTTVVTEEYLELQVRRDRMRYAA